MPEKRAKDVFLCHASDDKAAVVRPLYEALERAEVSCWLDEAEIRWGESISAQIDRGLSTSRFLLVVLSPAFLKKSFPEGEMRSALMEQLSTGEGRVLPLLVGAAEPILERFPLLKDRRHLVWGDDPQRVVREFLAVVRPEAKTVSRVCFISSEYPPHVLGGLGVHVGQLTAALAAHLEVDVVLPSPEDEDFRPAGPQVHLHSLANAHATYEKPVSWLRFSRLAADRIERMAREVRPAVIHCHDWVTVLAGIKARWALGVPLVFHLHLPNRSRLCASAENLGLICADLVTVNSEAMHTELMDRHLLRGDAEVVRNGVDLDAFRPAEDWPADDGYVLFVGRLVEQKGVETLLRAFTYVREKFPDVRLKIAGDGELRPALEGFCASRLLADQVDFLGWKTGEELVALYQKAAVLAVPSIYEPFGMTALEALACQRPVVASRVGGLKEIVRPGVTGYLADPRDELELAQWLMALLANSDLRQRMGAAGREFVVRERYTWPEIARQYVRSYERLVGTEPDLRVPARAAEFRDQVVSVAREDAPELGEPGNDLLEKLFDWMDRP